MHGEILVLVFPVVGDLPAKPWRPIDRLALSSRSEFDFRGHEALQAAAIDVQLDDESSIGNSISRLLDSPSLGQSPQRLELSFVQLDFGFPSRQTLPGLHGLVVLRPHPSDSHFRTVLRQRDVTLRHVFARPRVQVLWDLGHQVFSLGFHARPGVLALSSRSADRPHPSV